MTDLPNFYRAGSSLTWNGTPYQGAEGVRRLMENMPLTRHEVQCFDCHPIPGGYILESSMQNMLTVENRDSAAIAVGDSVGECNTWSSAADGKPGEQKH